MATDRLLIFWGYLIEVVLVAAVYAVCISTMSPQGITTFLLDTKDAWVSAIGVLLGAGFGLLIAVFVNVLFTDFGEYLQARGSGATYVWAFATPVLIFLSTIALLIVAGWAKRWEFAHVAFVLLVYSVVNGITMTKNTVELAILYMTFRRYNQRR
jgi:hypothetical protein